ncbi:succinylglutamate desuccinylase/aspartoacylase family protein [Indioceanicola profundi]|uniref:succinylglutamate desuccinylase/aspartoacylase family protein n=1 Tax=Indioceanicola profundi TaxID=2220096 RepID=UPI000E6A9E2C|nr:M14 family metallopeptidase [Indioceanicola profundi]
MTHDIQDIPLPHGRPGTQRSLRVHRFGTAGAAPKVYIQAGLHAGEIPGLLVAGHLLGRLRELDAAGTIRGEIVLVPMANPIGIDQTLQGQLLGRFELASGVNFNRAFPNLTDRVAELVGDRVDPGAAGVAAIRAALRQALAVHQISSQADALRRTLLSYAMDADVVLDLHCDSEAAMHLYTMPELWDGFADLSARLGCRAALLEADSGGEPFDETCSGFWRRLGEKLGADLPMACAATTVELRGMSDVDDPAAAADADAIISHLMVRGAIAGEPEPAPAPLCAPTPLAGVDRVKAPVAGVIVYKAAVGQTVQAGDLVAEILDPWSGDRHPCRAIVSGPVWSRSQERFAGAGDTVMSIAGTQPLPRTGSLLTA